MSDTVNGTANRTAMVKKVKEVFREIMGLEDERAETNAAIAELYAKLKRMGLSVKAARASLARYKLENDQRELWDETFDLTADALGVAIEFQPDFFEDEETFNVDAADKDPNEDGDPDGEEQEQDHLSDEEREAAANAEQEEGDQVLTELAPETQAATEAVATKH